MLFAKKQNGFSNETPDYIYDTSFFMPFEGDLKGVTPEKLKELREKHSIDCERERKARKDLWLLNQHEYFDSLIEDILRLCVEGQLFVEYIHPSRRAVSKKEYCYTVLLTSYREELNEIIRRYGYELTDSFSGKTYIREYTKNQQ